ncbi:MAG TPA: serine hydrolase domain-containing protein [Gemmatimonadaceae bacterium]
MRAIRTFLPFAALLFATGSATAPDDLDAFVAAQMARRHLPGLSLAIVQDGKIVEARAYGVTDAGGTQPVTTTTLFQAGSISKSVAALGALHLVDDGKLSLDGDVNGYLRTWKVPDNELTARKYVTLRGLLSHTAGLTVHGFPGYAVTEQVPTLVQVLDGAPPANTPAIRVEALPGSRWSYSGGGYTILQQMMLDVAGQSFPDYMRRTVLAPIGMTNSSYEQPLPPALAARTAAGHYQGRERVEGRWHVYPEMAAAGLWTTPTDLAKFAIEVQQTAAGASSRVISPATARLMLTEQMSGDGLGVFLQDTGRAKLFMHNGRDEGFDAQMIATAATGQGLVVMINANDDSRMVSRITAFVARKYHWPNAASFDPPTPATVPVAAAVLRTYTGRYELTNNNMVTLVPCAAQLCTSVGGYADEELVWLGDGRFASTERKLTIAPVRDSSGTVVALTWMNGAQPQRVIPRVGPLAADLARQRDPDPAFTDKLTDVLRAMAQGGQSVATNPTLAAGVRRDFSRGPWPPAAGVTAVRFIGAEDVSRRHIERHDGAVDRILYYTISGKNGERTLLVYVTKDGLITDLDMVDV